MRSRDLGIRVFSMARGVRRGKSSSGARTGSFSTALSRSLLAAPNMKRRELKGSIMQRGEIFARDNYRCVFCGQVFPEEELTVDHLQARSRGGDRSGGNLVTACGACNLKKGRIRLANYLAENPEVYLNFKQYAIHAWKRHLAAIEEEVRSLDKRPAIGDLRAKGGERRRPR